MRRRRVWIFARIVVPLVPAGIIAFIGWVFTLSTLPIWGRGIDAVLIPALAAYGITFGVLWLVPDPEPKVQTGRTIALVLLVLTAILTISLALWVLGLVAKGSSAASCVAGLAQLQGAKAAWALKLEKASEDLPTWNDLIGSTSYLQQMPRCPTGGAYTLCVVGEPPRCSVPGHVLEWAQSSNRIVLGPPKD